MIMAEAFHTTNILGSLSPFSFLRLHGFCQYSSRRFSYHDFDSNTTPDLSNSFIPLDGRDYRQTPHHPRIYWTDFTSPVLGLGSYPKGSRPFTRHYQSKMLGTDYRLCGRLFDHYI